MVAPKVMMARLLILVVWTPLLAQAFSPVVPSNIPSHSEHQISSTALHSASISAGEAYRLLGLKRGASAIEIRQAYIRLAKKYHPDLNAGQADKFKAVAEAYAKAMANAKGFANASFALNAAVKLGSFFRDAAVVLMGDLAIPLLMIAIEHLRSMALRKQLAAGIVPAVSRAPTIIKESVKSLFWQSIPKRKVILVREKGPKALPQADECIASGLLNIHQTVSTENTCWQSQYLSGTFHFHAQQSFVRNQSKVGTVLLKLLDSSACTNKAMLLNQIMQQARLETVPLPELKTIQAQTQKLCHLPVQVGHKVVQEVPDLSDLVSSCRIGQEISKILGKEEGDALAARTFNQKMEAARQAKQALEVRPHRRSGARGVAIAALPPAREAGAGEGVVVQQSNHEEPRMLVAAGTY